MTTKEITERLNRDRSNNSGEYSRKEFIAMFATSLGISNSAQWLTLATKLGIINVRKDGIKSYYSYSSNPIYMGVVETFIQKRKEKIKSWNRKPALEKESAIKFLQNLGYKILKPQKLSFDKVKEILGDKINECYEYEEL